MKSFRGQLIAWIAGTVALALLALGGAMSAVNLREVAANIDHDLQSRGDGMAQDRNRPPPRQQRPSPGGPGFQMRGDESDLIGSIRRPRLFWMQRSPGPPPDDLFDPVAAEKAAKGERLFSNVKYRNEQVRVYSAPMFRDGHIEGVVQLAHELREYETLKRVQTRTLLLVLPFAILAAAGVAFFLTGRVVKPIGQMSEAARAIAEGDFAARLPTQGLDEFAQLGEQFNEMASKVETSVISLQSSLEQQRRFTADASHELRTPLTRLQLATSASLAAPDSDPISALKIADEAAQDMSNLVRQLLDLARADIGDLGKSFSELDLRVVVADAVAKLGHPIEVSLDDHAVTVTGDARQLERVCLNLLENAMRHSAEKPIKIKLTQSELVVSDEGEGIAPEHLDRVTERFYRVDSARNRSSGGSGLGLAIVEEIVRAHGWTMKIESQVGLGTTARIKGLRDTRLIKDE